MSRLYADETIEDGFFLMWMLEALKNQDFLDGFDQLGRAILTAVGSTGGPDDRLGAAAAEPLRAIRLPADSLGLGAGDQQYPMVNGGTTPPDSGQRFHRFEVGTVDQAGNFTVVWTAKDLPGFTAAELVSILTDTDLRYERFVSLFDDDTQVTGTGFDDEIEVGAGDDVADLRGGDDLLRKWKPGDLDYDGGGGFDYLSFDKAMGDFATHEVGAVVNLARGKGVTPFGGQLTLTGVEGASGTEFADRLTGNAADNQFTSGKGGADTIRGGAGDDAITVDHNFGVVSPGRVIDGGAGRDTLNIYGDGPSFINRLDLTDQANNTGVFAGGVFSGFESFVFLTPGFDFYSFDVTGTAADETFRAGPGDDTIDGGGGDDRFIEVGGADSWIGGAGRDRVDYSLFLAGVAVNLAAGTGSGGEAEGDNFDGIEDVTGTRGHDSIGGDDRDNRLDGFDGNDLLTGGKGADRLTGGLGLDTLRGGADADAFVFAAMLDSAATRDGADVIQGFETGMDRIDLSEIDARPLSAADNAFQFVAGAFTAVGQVRVKVVGGTAFVELNTIAGAAPEMVIRVTGDIPGEGDFVL